MSFDIKRLKNNHFYPLLLIPSILLTQDFLASWFIIYSLSALIIISIVKLPKTLASFNLLGILYVFYEANYSFVPETTISALSIILISRMLQSQSSENKDSIEIPLYFLWLGVYGVFSSTLYYLMYATLFILIIFTVKIFYKNKGQPLFSLVKGQAKTFSIVFLMASLLFIFFPRFRTFLPSVSGGIKGQIGYSQKINNSETANLSQSSKTAFFAETEKEIPIHLRYWRGRIHNFTDGYNWKSLTTKPISKKVANNEKNLFKTKLKYEDNFDGDIILLESPHSIIESNLGVYKINETNEYRTYIKKKKSYVISYSRLQDKIQTGFNEQNRKIYTQLPKFLPRAFKKFANTLNAQTPNQIILNFKKAIIKDKFSYTLKPGELTTMAMFLKKKAGYCTHFASLLGVTLRYYNIPTRLVSGFQGGNYNQHGKYYQVSSNDAHVWVEYYHNKSWNRVDPTGFISPDRINLGGENFFQGVQNRNDSNVTSGLRSAFNSVKLYMSFLNYRFSLFVDNYNSENQKGLMRKLKLTKKQFYLLGGSLLLFIMGLIYYFLPYREKRKLNELEKLLYLYGKKYKIDTMNIDPQVTKSQLIKMFELQNLENNQKEEINTFINLYFESKYAKKIDHKEKLKEIIYSQ